MRSIALLLVLILWSVGSVQAQKHDFVWPMGYLFPNATVLDSVWGITYLDFNSPDGNPAISVNYGAFIALLGINAPANDCAGNHLFLCDGYRIRNSNNQVMSNGTGLSLLSSSGSSTLQGGLTLPSPGDPLRYFHFTIDYLIVPAVNDLRGKNLLQSVIDFPPGGGDGSVTAKRQEILVDTIDWDDLTAVRHANGRDWWVLMPEEFSNRLYVFIVTPEGMALSHTQTLVDKPRLGHGQVVYSPDGHYYAMVTAPYINGETFLDLYDFDRCAGLLTNHRVTTFTTSSRSIGVAFSPNSRFLYLGLAERLYQFDLNLPSLDSVLVDAGGYPLWTPGNGLYHQALYGPLQLAPDGRIYAFNIDHGNVFLNRIELPNLPAPACHAVGKALRLPTIAAAPPNYPNFRLGPVDGTVCDTLGIDNVPWAHFRYEQDTALPQRLYFTDLSAYEPTTWFWTFGDGATSQDTSPVHEYTATGTYEICLTVSNAHGADTLCRTVTIGTLGITSALPAGYHITSFPNPFGDAFSLQLPGDYLPVEAIFRLYDLNGREVMHRRVYAGWNRMEPPASLPPGVYAWTVTDGAGLLGSGTVVRRP